MFKISVDNWEGAACSEPGVDPDIFYEAHYKSVYEAKKVCDRCPLVMKCLDYALDEEEEWGVWGGLSADERRKLRKAR
jgi:WhiB family redox-sensing transcriptional regulator